MNASVCPRGRPGQRGPASGRKHVENATSGDLIGGRRVQRQPHHGHSRQPVPPHDRTGHKPGSQCNDTDDQRRHQPRHPFRRPRSRCRPRHRQPVPQAPPVTRAAHRRCGAGALADPWSGSGRSDDARPVVSLLAAHATQALWPAHSPAHPAPHRPRTDDAPRASRTAHNRMPRCRRADRPACLAPAPDSYRPAVPRMTPRLRHRPAS